MKTRLYPALFFLILSNSLMADDEGKLNGVYRDIRVLTENTINSLLPSCHFESATKDITHYRASLSGYSCGSELTNVITALDPIIDKCVKNNSTSQSCLAITAEYIRLLKKQGERGQMIALNEY